MQMLISTNGDVMVNSGYVTTGHGNVTMIDSIEVQSIRICTAKKSLVGLSCSLASYMCLCHLKYLCFAHPITQV